MSEAASTALVPAGTTSGNPLAFTGENIVFSTLPKERRADIIKFMQGKNTPVAEMIGKRITVQHVLAHYVDVVDKDGVVKTAPRIVLISPDGKAYQAVSDGVRSSIRLIAQFYGSPPWDPPLSLEVQQLQTKRGFRTFTLTPVS